MEDGLWAHHQYHHATDPALDFLPTPIGMSNIWNQDIKCLLSVDLLCWHLFPNLLLFRVVKRQRKLSYCSKRQGGKIVGIERTRNQIKHSKPDTS